MNMGRQMQNLSLTTTRPEGGVSDGGLSPHPIKRYVLGFAFTYDGSRVLLLDKLRPDWQAGKLNGIGGKVEAGERPTDAMIREFREETGVDRPLPWHYFGVITSPEANVYLFRAFDTQAFLDASTVTDEPIVRVYVNSLPAHVCIPNVPGLISLALDPQRPLVVLSYS